MSQHQPRTKPNRNGQLEAEVPDPEVVPRAERLLLAYNPRFRQLIEAADTRIQETGGIPHEEFWETVEDVNS